MASCFLIVFLLVVSTAGTSGCPDVDNVPEFARWLVRTGTWGILSFNTHTFVPKGYVASYTDAGTGSPYFYLSLLDPAGAEALNDVRYSLTLSEISSATAEARTPQSPSCAKITLSGELLMLPGDSDEGAKAERALFKAHPSFSGFLKMNGTFAVYKLLVDEIISSQQDGATPDALGGGLL